MPLGSLMYTRYEPKLDFVPFLVFRGLLIFHILRYVWV